MTFFSTTSGDSKSATEDEPDRAVRLSIPARDAPMVDGVQRFAEVSRGLTSYMNPEKPGVAGPAPSGDLRDPGNVGCSVRVELLRLRTLRLLERLSSGVGGGKPGDIKDVADVVVLDGTLDDP